MGNLISKTIYYHPELDDVMDAVAEWAGNASVPIGKAIKPEYKARDQIRIFDGSQFEDFLRQWYTPPGEEEETSWERVARENNERIQDRKQNKMKAKRDKAAKKANKNNRPSSSKAKHVSRGQAKREKQNRGY
jgi:hypothetical protein